MALRSLLRGDTKHPNNVTADNGIHMDSGIVVFQILNEEGFYVDPQRQLIHPSFNQVEGEGIFTYTNNPPVTRGLILGPAPLVETALQKTLTGTIVVQFAQNLEDVIIREIWPGSSRSASVLAEMYRKFYEFWTTIPPAGQFCIWQPADVSVESYGVLITNVQLGPQNTVEYREWRDDLSSREGAYLAETLTVDMKIVSEMTAPRGSITLQGL
jgi:hypothetical protein